MQRSINIGLFGFGVVGEGFYHLLNKSEFINGRIVKICVRNAAKSRSVSTKNFTDNPAFIIEDESINIIVELISDAETAYTIVKSSLMKGKHVISANKKMISLHLNELIEIARSNNVNFLYEAAVGGSIPIIRSLESYYLHDEIESIDGIINGSTNFILDRMATENESLNSALKKARELGFAESDPTQDMEGLDAVNKLKILAKHAFGFYPCDSDIIKKGITSIRTSDIIFARRNNLKIKLIAHASVKEDRISAYLLPQFTAPASDFYNVSEEFNAIRILGKMAGVQILKGKGAGRYPTSLAVLADLSSITKNHKYIYRKERKLFTSDEVIKIYLSFPLGKSPDPGQFEQIFCKHKDNGIHQWLGEIRKETLCRSNWFYDRDYSFITFPSSFPLDFKEMCLSDMQHTDTASCLETY